MADPHWSQIFKDLATGIGLLGAGGWAIWRWGFAEAIRRRREAAYVEVTLSARVHAEAGELCLASISLEWHNTGVESLTASSRLDCYILSDPPWDSPFLQNVEELLRPNFSKDLEGQRNLGPGTRGIIEEFLVLKPSRLYFFVWWLNEGSSRPIRRELLFYSGPVTKKN